MRVLCATIPLHGSMCLVQLKLRIAVRSSNIFIYVDTICQATCFQLNQFHLSFQIQQNRKNQMALGKIYQMVYFQLLTFLFSHLVQR